MIIMKCYFILLLSIISIGCSSHKQKDNQSQSVLPVINLSDNIQEVKSLPLSDVAERIEFISLELTDKSLVGEIDGMYVSEHHIWIGQNHDGRILRFSREGKFLNSVGKKGQGPGEYVLLKPYSPFLINEKRKEVYAITSFQGVLVYDFDGTFKRKQANYQTIYQNETCSAECQYFTFNDAFFAKGSLPTFSTNKDSLFAFAVLDSSFQFRRMFKNPSYIGREEEIIKHQPDMKKFFNYWQEIEPSTDSYANELTIKFADTDTVYRYDFSQECLTPQYAIKSNEKKGDYGATHQWFKELSVFDYWRISGYIPSKDFIYLFGNKGEEAYLYRYEKSNGQVRLLKRKGEIRERVIPGYNNNSPFRAFYGDFSFDNDLCGGKFTARYRSEGKYWTQVFMPGEDEVDIEKIRTAEVKDAPMRDRFVKELENLRDNEDSNPLLMIVTLK